MDTSKDVIITADGSKTIYLPLLQETYHSVKGAVAESQHVFIQNGLLAIKPKKPIRVFEVGFGSGLNALLTAIEAWKMNCRVEYFSVDNDRLSTHVTEELNYGRHFGQLGEDFFRLIHSVPWNVDAEIHPFFILHKIKADFLTWQFTPGYIADVVYFDAFGPDKQPEMWSPLIFRQIYEVISANGLIVTYSAKGEVRRRMASAGFYMQRLPGAPGKREMLRGMKI